MDKEQWRDDDDIAGVALSVIRRRSAHAIGQVEQQRQFSEQQYVTVIMYSLSVLLEYEADVPCSESVAGGLGQSCNVRCLDDNLAFVRRREARYHVQQRRFAAAALAADDDLLARPQFQPGNIEIGSRSPLGSR